MSPLELADNVVQRHVVIEALQTRPSYTVAVRLLLGTNIGF